MVFRSGRENFRSVALNARSNDGFVFEVCVRAPPYPSADFFYLVPSASLWHSGGVGKISEAPRPARDRMPVSFLRFACGHRRIHQLIFFLGRLGSPVVFKRVRENIQSVAPSARSNDGFVFGVCVQARIHQLFFFLGHLGFPMVFRRGWENIRSAALGARSNDSFFLRCACGQRRIHQLIFFSWSPRLPYGIQEGSGKYLKRRAQRAIA